MYKINHIHLKSSDPKSTANWWVKAFNFKIKSDTTRSFGDRFIMCESEGGLAVNISNERTGETLGQGDSNPHFGLEHFGLDSDDIDSDIGKLVSMGAILAEGPFSLDDGRKIAFLKVPGDVRVELIQGI
jgi:lactoylglutathione lyase